MQDESQPTVYIETSIISFLTARPSRDLVVAAHQQITLEWWRSVRPNIRPVISELVVQEAALGDAESARRRLESTRELPVLALSPSARELARALLEQGRMPPSAAADALHIAAATAHGADFLLTFLLTWNCRHIANAKTRILLERILRDRGYDPPVLCTPEELMDL